MYPAYQLLRLVAVARLLLGIEVVTRHHIEEGKAVVQQIEDTIPASSYLRESDSKKSKTTSVIKGCIKDTWQKSSIPKNAYAFMSFIWERDSKGTDKDH